MPLSLSNGSIDRSALILYGTETGNAQDVAYDINQSLERLYFATTTKELNNATLRSLLDYDLVVIAISTTGQGEFPSNSRRFWRSLLRKKLSSTALQDVSYGLVGLCDSSYPKFNLAARRLHKRLQQLGATPLLVPCEADEQGEEGTEGAFLSWITPFQEQVLAHFPLEDGKTPIPIDQRLPSQWILTEAHVTVLHYQPNHHDGQKLSTEVTANLEDDASFTVTLEQNDRVTPLEHWQDVRLLKLRAERPVNYMPGDAIAIRPRNLEADVDDLLNLLGWQNVANSLLKLQKNQSTSETEQSFDTILSLNQTFTLKELLTEYLDINAIPRRSFFSKIAHFTEDEMQKERALEFADPQYLDEYFDYATRPRRSILEVLQEFHTVKIPWREAINLFPLLRPRQFSVASGGPLKENGCVFELLVAIVRYKTVIKRIREGVCTKYLARLPMGTKLNVTLHTEGRFHDRISDYARTHLLIGGGTGIAPLRSIIHEQSNLVDRQIPSILVFGCRNAASDYFFQDEWKQMTSQSSRDQEKCLHVITAFSRDQQSKIYLQDRIREFGKLIHETLQKPDSIVIVCGSSGAMPKAVREALKDVLACEPSSGFNESQAEEVLVDLEKSGRYKQETW